jgi:hypothetical protein
MTAASEYINIRVWALGIQNDELVWSSSGMYATFKYTCSTCRYNKSA